MTVAAVVVLFHPDPPLLQRQHAALCPQVDRLVYVDNGDGVAALAAAGICGEIVVGDGENLGLARAVNRGVEVAAAEGGWAVLLLDQDSIPADDLVATLAAGLRAGLEGPVPAAAIGPAIVDALVAAPPEFIVRMRPLVHRTTSAAPGPVDVAFLMTSGTLVSLAAWRDLGGLDESMFVDSLDLEWGFRATSRGYRLLGTFATSLEHRRGDRVIHRPPLPPVRVHAASRLYWMHRNRVSLYRRPYVPRAWKVQDVGRVVAKLGLLVAVLPGRRATLGAVARGLYDGARDAPPRPEGW